MIIIIKHGFYKSILMINKGGKRGYDYYTLFVDKFVRVAINIGLNHIYG